METIDIELNANVNYSTVKKFDVTDFNNNPHVIAVTTISGKEYSDKFIIQFFNVDKDKYSPCFIINKGHSISFKECVPKTLNDVNDIIAKLYFNSFQLTYLAIQFSS